MPSSRYPASGGAGAATPDTDIWELVTGFPDTLASAVTEYTFSGLASHSYDYDIEAQLVKTSGGNTNITEKFNGVTTGISRARLNVVVGSITSSGSETSAIIGGESTTLIYRLRSNPAEQTHVSVADAIVSTGSIYGTTPGGIVWADPAEVTSFTVVSSAVSGLEAGTVFRLYRRAKS